MSLSLQANFDTGHNDLIEGIRATANSKQFVTCSFDMSIKVWDVENKKLHHSFDSAHDNWVSAMDVSSDYKIISGSFHRGIRIWDMNNTRCLKTIEEAHTGAISAVTISPDNKLFASGSHDGTLKVWIFPEAILLDSQSAFDLAINCLAFTSDSSKVIISDKEGCLAIYDVDSKKIVKKISMGEQQQVLKFVLNEGEIIGITASDIKVFDVNTLETKKTISNAHEQKITSISKSATKFVTGSMGTKIHLWDLKSKDLVKTLEDQDQEWVKSIAITPDEKYVMAGMDSRNRAVIWDVAQGKIIKQFHKHHEIGEYSIVKFTHDKKKVVSGSTYGHLTVWNTEKREVIAQNNQVHNGESITDVAITNDDKQIVTAGGDGNITIWDINNLNIVETLSGHKNQVNGIALTGDNSYLISIGHDKTCQIWNFKTAKVEHKFDNCHDKSKPVKIAALNDNNHFITVAYNRSIKLWSAKDRKLVHDFGVYHSDEVSSVIVSSDDRYLITGSGDRTIKIMDLESRKLAHEFDEIHDQYGPTALRLTRDNRYLVASLFDNSIRIWDSNNYSLLSNFAYATPESLNSMDLSEDNEYIIGASFASLLLWRLATKETKFDNPRDEIAYWKGISKQMQNEMNGLDKEHHNLQKVNSNLRKTLITIKNNK